MKKIIFTILSTLLLLTNVYSQSNYSTTSNTKCTVQTYKSTMSFSDFTEFNKLKPQISSALKIGNAYVVITIPSSSRIHNYDILQIFITEYICPLLNSIHQDSQEINDLRYNINSIEERISFTNSIKINILKTFIQTNIMSASECERLIKNEKENNQKHGLGYISNSEVEKQRTANQKLQYGHITDFQADAQRNRNQKLGYGFITDKEKYRDFPDAKEKEDLAFQKSRNELKTILNAAENYRNNKQFCYALGAYYDALQLSNSNLKLLNEKTNIEFKYRGLTAYLTI